LQLTAPDELCGIVYVRGRFPNTPASILARAQKKVYQCSKDTFGTRLERAKDEADLELGECRAQGWVNFRWPYIQYHLKRQGDTWDSRRGTFEEISFVKDGTVFQIIRMKIGHTSSSTDDDMVDVSGKQTIKIEVGGEIRFGCPCSNHRTLEEDTFVLKTFDERKNTYSCISSKYQKRVDMQLWINSTAQSFEIPESVVQDAEAVDASYIHEQQVQVGEIIYIVASYSIRNYDDKTTALPGLISDEIQDYIGFDPKSLNMTDRLWTALCSPNYEAIEAVEFCAIGRCVERIMSVSSVPIHDPHGDGSSNTGFGAGVAKELMVEEMPEIALLPNIITPQCVDVQSSL
jgi:hypothetical protein